MMPKASKDELGSDVSGAASFETGVIELSPYLILYKGGARCARWSFGITTIPSRAAQMITLRAKLGILGSELCLHQPKHKSFL